MASVNLPALCSHISNMPQSLHVFLAYACLCTNREFLGRHLPRASPGQLDEICTNYSVSDLLQIGHGSGFEPGGPAQHGFRSAYPLTAIFLLLFLGVVCMVKAYRGRQRALSSSNSSQLQTRTAASVSLSLPLDSDAPPPYDSVVCPDPPSYHNIVKAGCSGLRAGAGVSTPSRTCLGNKSQPTPSSPAAELPPSIRSDLASNMARSATDCSLHNVAPSSDLARIAVGSDRLEGLSDSLANANGLAHFDCSIIGPFHPVSDSKISSNSSDLNLNPSHLLKQTSHSSNLPKAESSSSNSLEAISNSFRKLESISSSSHSPEVTSSSSFLPEGTLNSRELPADTLISSHLPKDKQISTDYSNDRESDKNITSPCDSTIGTSNFLTCDANYSNAADTTKSK